MVPTPSSSSQTKSRPTQGQWTYQDYLDLPDDGRRYEIIEGVLYVTNAPSFFHQFTAAEIYRQIANFVIEHSRRGDFSLILRSK